MALVILKTRMLKRLRTGFIESIYIRPFVGVQLVLG